MDIVSFETAKKLKAAGFPKPDPKTGMVWYRKSGMVIILEECRGIFDVCLFNRTDLGVHYTDQYWDADFFNEDNYVFAPSATDILRQMPDYAIAFDDSQRPHGFTCYDAMRRQPQLKQFWTMHENPAEAAAEMYLSLNATEFEMKITGKLNDTVND